MKKPYVVTFTVTYRNRILVNAESPEDAEDFASDLYEGGDYDPERNGYAGCNLDVMDAGADDIAELKFDTYTAEFEDEEDEQEE